MRILGKLVLAMAALVALESMPQAQWWNRVQHTSIHFGARFLENETFWEPTDQPWALGFEYDARSLDSGLGWEAATFFAFDSEDNVFGTSVDVDLFLLEANLGGRYTFVLDRLHPYVGGGLGLIYADITARSGGSRIYDNDFSVGGYAHTGAYYRITDAMTLGVDFRGLFGTSVDFDTPLDGDVDYLQVTGTIGWMY